MIDAGIAKKFSGFGGCPFVKGKKNVLPGPKHDEGVAQRSGDLHDAQQIARGKNASPDKYPDQIVLGCFDGFGSHSVKLIQNVRNHVAEQDLFYFRLAASAAQSCSGPAAKLIEITAAGKNEFFQVSFSYGVTGANQFTPGRFCRLSGPKQRLPLFTKFKLVFDQRFKFGERSEEHTSELQSLMRISYAVFCLKKKKKILKQKIIEVHKTLTYQTKITNDRSINSHKNSE